MSQQPPAGPPPSTPPPAGPPPAGSSAPKGRGRLAGVAAGSVVLGLVIGVLIGFLVFHDGKGSRADQDLDAGCAVVERLDEGVGTDVKKLPGLDDPDIWEIQAASQMFVAASKADEDAKKWEKPGNDLVAGFQRFDQKLIDKSLGKLVDMCADR